MPPVSQFENLVAKGVDDTLTTVFVATDDCYFIQLDVKGPPTVGVQVDFIVHNVLGGIDVEWLEAVPLPVGATLQILEGSKLVLKAGDELKLRCATPGELINLVGSYVDKVND